MCGISGYCGPNKETEKLSIMTESIKRRGPDDFGYYESNGVGFGFRRLSVIDLSTGHQPLSNKDESVWVMLNGEIYNYKELREELKKIGCEFKTESDTEVIAHAYDKWHDQCFRKFDGMFAIAIWDKNYNKLILGRDRFGKKPLYWTIQKDTLWFASELKSLINGKVFLKEIDLESVYLFFNTDYVPTPKSIFKNVYKLEPSTFLTYQDGKITMNKFWSPLIEEINLSEKEIVRELSKKIDKAVQKRLVSDVPLGLFLSGGLDSTIIAESASRQSPGIQAFTLSFEDKSYDETLKAIEIANIFGLKHHLEILSEDKALEMIEEATELLDEPLSDPSIIPQLLLSRFTKENVTVTLSGDGGDELLLGYQHIPAHIITEKLSFLGTIIPKVISWMIKKIPSNNDYFSLGFKLQRLSRGLPIKNKFERDLAWRGSFVKNDLNILFKKKILSKINLDKGWRIMENYAKEYGDNKSWAGWSFSYLRTYLMDCVLVKVDRATMWNGLESRAPLLDTEVATFLLNLPDKYKLGKWKGKKLFKKILEGKIPREILNTPKHGFGVPVAKWLKGPLYEELLKLSTKEVIDKQNIFNREFIIQMIDEHKTGKTDRRKELWSFFIFQKWYNRWIN